MDEDKRLVLQAWLIKALHDLVSAQRLAEGNEPLFDTAIYHCQQSGEKALKAFLVYHDIGPLKTHDLDMLAKEASVFTPEFSDLRDAGKRLTQYATLFRYPGEQSEPTEAEYKQAYQDAADFLRVTLALIPAEAHPAG